MNSCHLSCLGLREFKQRAMACLVLAYCVEPCAMSCPYSGAGMRITLSDDSLESHGHYLACYEEDGYFHSFFVPHADWLNESPDPFPDFYFNTHSNNLNLYLSSDIETFFLPVTLSEYSEIVVRKIDSASPDHFFLYFLWSITNRSFEVVSGGYCEWHANSSEVLKCLFGPEQDIIRLKTEVPLYRSAKAGEPDKYPLRPPSGDDGYPPSYLLILQSRLQKKEFSSEKKSFPMQARFLSQSYRGAEAWFGDILSDIGIRVSAWYKGELAQQNRFIEVYMYGQDGHQKDDENPRPKPSQHYLKNTQEWSGQEDTGEDPEQQGGPRAQFTPGQLIEFEAFFQQSHYPTLEQQQALSAQVNIPVERVGTWFRNRRAKMRKQLKSHSLLQGGASNAAMPDILYYPDPMFSGYRAAQYSQATDLSGTGLSAQPMMPQDTQSQEDSQCDGQNEDEIPRPKPPELSSREQKTKGSGRKRTRTVLTRDQIQTLEATFGTTPNPASHTKQSLASSLGLEYKTVTWWFQYRRKKLRKENSAFHNRKAGAGAAMIQNPLPPSYGFMSASGSVAVQSYLGSGLGGADLSAHFTVSPDSAMPPQSASQVQSPGQYPGSGQGPGIYPPPYGQLYPTGLASPHIATYIITPATPE